MNAPDYDDMALVVPDNLFAHFAADPIGLWRSIPELARNEQGPLTNALASCLAGVPPDVVEEVKASPTFLNYHRGHFQRGEEQEAREWALMVHLTRDIPARRLQALADNSVRAPYDHPALTDVAVDKDGLVPLRSFAFDRSVLEKNGHLFLPAPSTESPNASYWLMLQLGRPDLRESVFVRLDPFLFGPAGVFPRMEYRMWLYGRPLDWERLESLQEPEYGEWLADVGTRGISKTDFVWTPRHDELHLTCEELPAEDSVDVRGARYFHAIYNRNSQVVTHVDGALRIYDRAAFSARRSQHVRNAGKAGKRAKLFRIDSPLSRERLADIATTFFVWNDDVGRYFGPVSE